MEIPSGRLLTQFILNDITWSVDIQKFWDHFIKEPNKVPRGVSKEFYAPILRLFVALKNKPGYHICFIRQDGHTTFIDHTKDGQHKVISVGQSCYNFAEVFSREKTLNRQIYPDGRMFFGMILETNAYTKV